MILKFSPRYFKCFTSESFRMSNLTLLTGINGSGKSSFIQALLLSQQAAGAVEYIKLNGPSMLQLGHAEDVRNLSTESANQQIAFEFALEDGTQAVWTFVGEGTSNILEVKKNPDRFSSLDECFISRFQYLCAERIGPRDVSLTDSRPSNLTCVGSQGEYVAQVIEARGLEKIRDGLLHPKTAEEGGGGLLGKQIERWMQEISPGLEIRTESFPGTNIITLRMRRNGETVEWLRPTNFAFGVTYSLPIIVGGLTAQYDSILIVENPEAHLHPSGQSRIGRFLATIAASGVQVVVETHSDHVLNGIRLAVADAGHPLSHENVVIHHFIPKANHGDRSIELNISSTGGLSHWPKDFFDQSERDLAQIIKSQKAIRQ